MPSRFLAALACSILALSALAPSVCAQDVATGERLFRTRCASCHSLEPGQNRIGPSLNGVIGRKAGSVEDARYSQGLRDSGITWDAAQLDTYLANPRAMVKGTTMTISVTNAADRSSLVTFLQSPPQTN